MGWSIGFDMNWKRDIGYEVPGYCDHPGCMKEINRGLSYVCGGEPYGGEHGCGLFFCEEHRQYAGARRDNAQLCLRCYHGRNSFEPTPDTPEWLRWKLVHPSWQEWRDENPELVETAKAHLAQLSKLAGPHFQERVEPWMEECFGDEISQDTAERNQRFLEEALELVQSCELPVSEAHQLVDYVYGRAVGEKKQEVGGVMVTLAALCLAQQLDMHEAGEVELERIWTKVDQIREKQKSKPALSPLPGVYPERLS